MKKIRNSHLGFAAASLFAIALIAPQPLHAGGAGDDHAAIRPSYDKLCASCHAKDGSADTATGKKMKVRPFSHPDVKKMTDAELTTAIATGKGKMPGYAKKLNAAQIAQMVKLVRAMGE